MSKFKDRLQGVLASVPASTDRTPEASAPSGPALGARTSGSSPGMIMEVAKVRTQLQGQIDALSKQLEAFDGALPTRKLPVSEVVLGEYANRAEFSYTLPAFQRLKESIAQAGGNVQPILVRPLPSGKYELVYGHRRLQACRELGLDVLALIQPGEMTTHDLVLLMDRENRERADLSPLEQGRFYKRLLDSGLFVSKRALAQSLAVSAAWVGQAVALAELPDAIFPLLADPSKLQVRHGLQLGKALELDSNAVMRRLQRLTSGSATYPVGALVDMLCADRLVRPVKGVLLNNGRDVGRWTETVTGATTIVVPRRLTDDQKNRVAAILSE